MLWQAGNLQLRQCVDQSALCALCSAQTTRLQKWLDELEQTAESISTRQLPAGNDLIDGAFANA